MTDTKLEAFKTKFENDPRFAGLISNSRLSEGYVRDAQYQLGRIRRIPSSRRNASAVGRAMANLQAAESRSAQVEKLVAAAMKNIEGERS